MPHSFSPDWLKKLSDPYAVLGVSVAADDQRVLKRYRAVAKLLHPDRYINADPVISELATQLFARLINPAYQTIKQERGRTETVALLRFQVRRRVKEGAFVPQSEPAKLLSQKSLQEANIFYEQAIAKLAEHQYQPLDQFEAVTEQLAELNLVYLQLKMGDIFIREKREGLVPTTEKRADLPTDPPLKAPNFKPNYADRHYERAQEYMKKGAWSQAVLELKDALKLEPNKGQYHSLLGLAYLRQDLRGTATAHFRRALQINPQDEIAIHFATKLNIQTQNGSVSNSSTKPEPKPDVKPDKSTDKASKQGGLFGRFRRQ